MSIPAYRIRWKSIAGSGKKCYRWGGSLTAGETVQIFQRVIVLEEFLCAEIIMKNAGIRFNSPIALLAFTDPNDPLTMMYARVDIQKRDARGTMMLIDRPEKSVLSKALDELMPAISQKIANELGI